MEGDETQSTKPLGTLVLKGDAEEARKGRRRDSQRGKWETEAAVEGIKPERGVRH